jgi:hypothetical protein
MLTSRTAHADRERENTHVKQYQGKAWATKSQQDWPINVAINSRLLACNTSWDKLYNHVRESRWFKTIYTLQEKTRPTHHTLSTLGLRMALDHTYLTWSTYSNLSWGCQQGWTDALLPRKNAPDSTSQPDWVVRGTCLSFSPNTTIEAVR